MHTFTGKWITDAEFFECKSRNVFHKQLDKLDLPYEHLNRHILFRKKFVYEKKCGNAVVYISADDYYKLYINGVFVCQGPAPSYHLNYNYNFVDVSSYLKDGENTIAVHTLYQGLINRVWQSGDNRHGLIMDLEMDGKIVVSSDDTFLTKQHSAYNSAGKAGYDTQFLETYDSRASEVGFEQPDFDDSDWERARIRRYSDTVLTEQKSGMLVFEKNEPEKILQNGNVVSVDFGANYVGYLRLAAKGERGSSVTVRCGQELNEDGSVRYKMRCNCEYEEKWILTDGESRLDWFDYKSFRYAEIILPDGCELKGAYLESRHYPFSLKAQMNPLYIDNEDLCRIWKLCVRTLEYGVQETIQDCMDREKGFYVGDGCYTALTQMVLTQDDSMVRKLIDDAFRSDFITDGLVTCIDCSFMQEIAEYPLMLISLVWWHYKLTGDKDYLRSNYPKIISLLDVYRKDYEKDGLISHLDKWCVVEWPDNYRDGYDVDLAEGKICTDTHIAINAYYYEAICTANRIAEQLGQKQYRETDYLKDKLVNAFYSPETHLFKDSASSDHVSLIGNVFPFAFGLCPDETCKSAIVKMITERKTRSLSLFCTFLALMGFVRIGRHDLIKEMLLDREAWLRMLREDATTTFEGWGKDAKWNTSLFHLTFSYAALFLANINLDELFK